MIWFTEGHHFSHANIIRYCNRPFSSVEEMDEEMIARWNSRVNKNEVVYHLGDFTLGDDANKYVRRLNGEIRFVTVPFHHDARWLEHWAFFEKIPAMLAIKHGNEIIIMCHYPIAVWDRKHHGSWHLYGHIHNKDFILPGFAMNVGVDFHDFYPVSYDEVKQHMVDLGWYPGWRQYA